MERGNGVVLTTQDRAVTPTNEYVVNSALYRFLAHAHKRSNTEIMYAYTESVHVAADEKWPAKMNK